MPIPTSDLQSASPSSVIELFELQLTAALHGSNDVYRFHSGSSLNANGTIFWNGNSYQRYPIEADGFEYSGNGQLPQPRLRAANLSGTITALMLIVNATTPGNDLIGAKLTRIRTLARYIDSANFPARRNLLTQTDSFNLSPWNRVRTVASADSVPGPFGTQVADLLRDDSSANNTHYVEQLVTALASGTQYHFSVYIRPAGKDFVRLELLGNRYIIFQLSRSRIVQSVNATGTIGDIGNGWYRCSIATTTASSGSATARIYLQSSETDVIYNGDGSTGVYLASAQLEPTRVSDYQPIGATFSQNPFGNPDPTVEFPREIYYISQKSNESRDSVEFILSSAFDLQGVRAPKRQCISNICQWVYRSAECGYTGTGYYNENDQPVGSLSADVCGKRLNSCRIRFGFISNIATAGFSASLASGSTLASGSKLVSSNGWYQLIMQTDGNLVVYDKSGLIMWSSKTPIGAAARLVMQSDGNAVVYRNSNNQVLWASNTGGSGGSSLAMQVDGNLVIYTSSGVPVWDSFSNGSNRIIGEPGNSSTTLPFGSFPGVGTFFA